MICPNCNRINSGQQCYVHNVITCLGCLYDGVKSFCDAQSFITQSNKFKAKKEADMNKLLDMIPRDNTWKILETKEVKQDTFDRLTQLNKLTKEENK